MFFIELGSQWGYKISSAKILNGQKEVGLKTAFILNGIWNLAARPFETLTNGSYFVKTIKNLDKTIQILNT